MLAAERFVVADAFPFSRQSWHNRTKIRTADEKGWQWLTIPRRHGGKDRSLNAMEVEDATPWARTHLRALQVNYSMAPFFDHHVGEIDALLSETYPSLGALTTATTKWVHEKIGGPSELVIASELPGSPGALEEVWEELGSFDSLLSLSESTERDAANLPDVTVETLHFAEQPYTQNFPGFVPGLSVLDMLFNNGGA